jgi:hypothetical protein
MPTYMVDNDNLPRTEQLLRDNDTAQRIGDPSSSIANDMGIALFETKCAGGI